MDVKLLFVRNNRERSKKRHGCYLQHVLEFRKLVMYMRVLVKREVHSHVRQHVALYDHCVGRNKRQITCESRNLITQVNATGVSSIKEIQKHPRIRPKTVTVPPVKCWNVGWGCKDSNVQLSHNFCVILAMVWSFSIA